MKTSATWAIQDAKAKFSQLIGQAVKDGPQHVTRHGRATAVVISEKDYSDLMRGQGGLVDFLRSSPLAGLELDQSRDPDPGREVDL